MNNKIISPKAHGLTDYILVAGLLTIPSLFGFSKDVKKIYAIEGLALLGYIAITKHPYALKPLIPFKTHGKIDPFNTLYFGVQTFFKSFARDKKAMAFNIAFTAVAATLVALTDWDGREK